MAEVAEVEGNECPICMGPSETWYKIGCNSAVPHEVCHDCEIQLRERVPAPKKKGILYAKFIKCPMCRGDETTIGERSQASWKKEITELYTSQDRAYSARRIHQLCQAANEKDARIRILQDELRVFNEENAALRHLFQALGIEGPVDVPAAPVVAPAAPVVAPVAPVVRVGGGGGLHPIPVAPAAPIRPQFCMSGRRELATCETRSRTKRKCSFVGCEKRVCQKCKRCTTH